MAERTAEERNLIRLAKEKLMAMFKLSEPAAYRFMQREAMERRMRLVDLATELMETGDA